MLFATEAAESIMWERVICFVLTGPVSDIISVFLWTYFSFEECVSSLFVFSLSIDCFCLLTNQMLFQAKLISLTRDANSRSHVGRQAPSSPESHIYIHSDNQKPTATQNKAFSKTTVHRQAPKTDYSDRIQKYSSMDQDESMSPLHTPAPRSRAPKPTLYDTSDIDYRSRALSPKGRSPKGKSTKTKSRPRSKSPFKENQGNSIVIVQ